MTGSVIFHLLNTYLRLIVALVCTCLCDDNAISEANSLSMSALNIYYVGMLIFSNLPQPHSSDQRKQQEIFFGRVRKDLYGASCSSGQLFLPADEYSYG